MKTAILPSLAMTAIVSMFSSAAYAWEQKLIPMTEVTIFTTHGGSLQVKGVATKIKETVNNSISSIEFRGNLSSGKGCPRYGCYFRNFSVSQDILLADLRADLNNDGNVDEAEPQVKLGTVKPSGEVVLSGNWKASTSFVQERYTWLEKLAGSRDANYIYMSVEKVTR